MNRRLIIGEDSVYEIDEACMRRKNESETACGNRCVGRKESDMQDRSVQGRSVQDRSVQGRNGNNR